MKLTTTAFVDGGVIPSEFAFCGIDPVAHVKLSGNLNPDFAWSGLPAGTKASFFSSPAEPSGKKMSAGER